MCAWINGWVYNGEAGDLGRQRAHYDVTNTITNQSAVGDIYQQWEN